MTFQGTNGGEIQQMQAQLPPTLVIDVDTEADANNYHGKGEPPYDKESDSYFLEPFTLGTIVALTESDNYYHIEAGTAGGEEYEDARLAYIVTSGDLLCNGVISRLSKNYGVLQTVEMPLPGDANRDGVVDGADYTAWADHYGYTDVTWADADFNGDDVTDGADYTVWADNYLPPSSSVPEPAFATVGLLGAWALLRRRSR
jgi:uncharacterized protein (TIGR03382 family)